MLSYLHGFHAGNAADVLKHSVLVFCLQYLKQKEKPLLCVDTHAGAGFYTLAADASAPTREWEKGIGRLAGTPAPPMIESYLKTAGIQAGSPEPRRYPGSPVLIAGLLEKGDRFVCFELHPRELETLKASMAEVRNADGPVTEVRGEDGRRGLKSLLPPPSRRGLILVDPSWEEQEEFTGVPLSVQEGLRRFPEGVFIVWYPLLALPKGKGAAPVRETLFSLSGGKRCRAELYTEAVKPGLDAGSPRGMYGSGLAVYNPPWTLRPALEEALPYLAKTLGGGNGGWKLD